jgi:alkaline phosphatase D
VVSGDLHAFVVGGLNRAPEDFSSPFVAPEFVASSITSDPGAKDLDCLCRKNPNVQLADNAHRGYLRFDVTPDQMRVDLVALNTVKLRHSRKRNLASYAVEVGRPVAVRA